MKSRNRKLYALSLPICLFLGALFSSSFDTFLVLDAGFTFRICQAFLLIPILHALTSALRRTHKFTPPAITSLNVFAGIAILSTLLHGLTPRAAGYCVWLIFNVVVIYITVQLFDNARKVTLLVRCYIYSFVFVACFGLFQFFAAAFGIGAFVVTQWWIPGRLPRISGFSYEPSYYATYLLLGWTLVAYILEQPRYQWPLKRLPACFGIMSVSLLLSSSRLGIMAMFLWGLRCLVKLPMKSRTRVTTSTKLLAGSSAIAVVVAVSAIALQSTAFDEFTFLLNGTGLAGTAAHSVNDRYDWFERTIEVFKKNPILGVGFGGIAEEIAGVKGLDPGSREDLKQAEGSSVGAEALAATGLVGISFFAGYLILLYRKSISVARRSAWLPIAPLIKGLLYALAVEFALLQFTQNIFRPYVWLHIAVLSTVVSFASRSSKALAPRGPIEHEAMLNEQPPAVAYPSLAG